MILEKPTYQFLLKNFLISCFWICSDTDYLHKLTELEHRNNQLSVCKTTLSEQLNILEADYEK